MTRPYSDYLVFVDESGDHGLRSIDPHYPVFVLAFCVVAKDDYVRTLTPALQEFKLQHFGHENIILHERDIRKDSGAFGILGAPERKDAFMTGLTNVVAAAPFTLVASVIRKDALQAEYSQPRNPYHLALGFGLERVHGFLRERGSAYEAITHVLVERRGNVEDYALKREFEAICAGKNYLDAALPFELVFADKKANLAGLQLADLVARPIGLHILRPGQPNRAFEIIEGKFRRSPQGSLDGWGLKCFP